MEPVDSVAVYGDGCYKGLWEIAIRKQQHMAGFFSKFLMGGGLEIFGPRQSPTGTKSDGGGTCEKKSDWSQNCPPNAKLGHFLLFKAWNTAF